MIDSSAIAESKIEKQQQIYKRVKLLGTGSFGKAYLVKQIKTDEYYVIKQIIISDMSQQQQQNALRQAKILEVLSHPNIVKFKQVYRTSKMRLNIVMQYANGGDLARQIKKAKKSGKYFQQQQILDWFTQICLGIKHIHDRKIIHRDLKAQNIFLTEQNIVKIGDFGVSKILQQTMMKARTVVGSPYYLSPQIIENKPYSFQTDIWSLGAVLYQMCALQPPFTANNLQFLALKIVKGTFGQIPTQYSSDLKSLIKSMLTTDASKRPTINKILTSRIISKRISNFLTNSKRMDEFSHTVIHNRNIIIQKTQALKPPLMPPPNLIKNQEDIENKSQIHVSERINEYLQQNVQSRPFTPLIGKKKGPNNFFNQRKSEKQMPDFNGLNNLIQIKQTPLQEKHKLPKVVTSPSLYEKKKTQNLYQMNKNQKNILQNKQVPQHAFMKNKMNSEIQTKISAINVQKIQNEKNKQGQLAAKWKKTPRTFQNQNISNISQKRQQIKKKQKQKQQIPKQKKEQIPKQKIRKIQSTKRIVCPTKKPSTSSVHNNNKQKANYNQSNKTNKNISRKNSNSNNFPVNFQLVSEQAKKKLIQEKNKKSSRNQSTNRKSVQKKYSPSGNKSKNEIISKKPSIPNKNINIKRKSSIKAPKQQQKKILPQPPKLSFKNSNQSDQEQKSQNKNKNFQAHEKQIVEEQKYNSQNQIKQKMDNQYYNEQFQDYQEQKMTQDLSDINDQQNNSNGSLTLSDSCHPNQKKQIQKVFNFNQMINEMQHIQKMINQANGFAETLPMFGQQLLQLPQQKQNIIRIDDTDLQSVIDDHEQFGTIPNIKQKSPNKQQIKSDFEQTQFNNSNNLNLTYLTNNEQLQTLKMNLEQLFGIQHIIFIYNFLNEIMQKQGLDFDQKQVQKQIMLKKPQINSIILKKYFRLIVTLITIQHENIIDVNC